MSIVLVSVVAAFNAGATLNNAAGFTPAAEVVRLLALLAIYVIAANLFDTPDKARKLFLVVVLSAIVPTVWGLVELVNGPVAASEDDVGPHLGPVRGAGRLRRLSSAWPRCC